MIHKPIKNEEYLLLGCFNTTERPNIEVIQRAKMKISLGAIIKALNNSNKKEIDKLEKKGINTTYKDKGGKTHIIIPLEIIEVSKVSMILQRESRKNYKS